VILELSGLKNSSRSIKIISTGNEELDRRIGEGVPKPSLIVIEGENGSGKTTLTSQLTYGACTSGLNCAFLTTEDIPQRIIKWARSISIGLDQYFLKGKLKVYSLPRATETLTEEKATEHIDHLISFFKSKSKVFDFIAVDSLSFLTVRSRRDVMDLFLTIKKTNFAAENIIVVTLHSDTLDKELKKYAISLCDIYYSLVNGEVAGRSVKVLKILKARGVPVVPEAAVAFEVDPAFGIKVVPIAVAKV